MEPNEFELRKFVAPEFIFGINARKLVGRYARNFGARKVLVVTDPGVAAAGWANEAMATLKEAGVEVAVFPDVSSNPKSEEVMEGAALYQRENCNTIVAVGGGSPMDCAKGIGIVSSNRKDVVEFEGVDNVEFPSPPLICIPTTAGSSADVSQFAIITDVRKKNKLAIISKMVVPDVALIDPVTTTSMPRDLTACTGMDALCHAMEAFVSTANSPITDVHALQAIQLVFANLLPTLNQPDNLVLRGRMMLASLEAGLAFSNASLGMVHAMSHSLGGLLDAPHGECNAILLPYIIDFNFSKAEERYREEAKAMGMEVDGMNSEEVKSGMVAWVTRLNESTGSSCGLCRLGVDRSAIPELAEKAMNDPCIFTNPRQPTVQDVEAIYEQAI